MSAILAITFPFFALVLCGYLAARGRLLSLKAIGGLNSFVLFFALPCMLYRFGASTPLAQLLDPGALLLWVLGGLLMVSLTVAWRRAQGLGWNDAAFGGLVAAFPNTGFMGMPMLVALLGAVAAGPTIVTIVVDMVITSSLCIALSRLDVAGQHGMAVAARRALRGVLVNPMPWAVVLGGCASASGWGLPAPLNRTVGLLADAASPVALFTLGAVLARSAWLASRPGRVARASWRGDAPVVLFKLLLHPLLVLLLGHVLRQLGVPLSAPAAAVLVLVAALPSASNVVMLAERYGADTGSIARIILWSTVVAFVSFPLAVALLR